MNRLFMSRLPPIHTFLYDTKLLIPFSQRIQGIKRESMRKAILNYE